MGWLPSTPTPITRWFPDKLPLGLSFWRWAPFSTPDKAGFWQQASLIYENREPSSASSGPSQCWCVTTGCCPLQGLLCLCVNSVLIFSKGHTRKCWIDMGREKEEIPQQPKIKGFPEAIHLLTTNQLMKPGAFLCSLGSWNWSLAVCSTSPS